MGTYKRRIRYKKKGEDPRLLVWAWGALEADFQRFYGMDLNVEVYEKSMSSRRFMTLVRGIPPESSFGSWYRDKTNRDFVSDFIQP